MPCYDSRNDAPAVYDEISRERKAHNRTKAMLCAIMQTVASQNFELKTFLNQVDWRAAGVKRKDLEAWWSEHKAADERRRAQEHKERRVKEEKENARKKALAKLTAEDRKALGIKK